MVSGSVDAGVRPWRVFAGIGTLYLGFGVVVALLQGGLPPILRARGMPVEQMAWVFALYLPVGLSFLWAPLVDRLRWPFLSPRIGWIVAAQAVAMAALVAVALLEHAALPLLFALGLVVALAVATMDLALDALAVEMTGEQAKPLAAALKLAALSLGALVGGGVFVGLLARIGWAPTFALVALLLALALVPVFGLTGAARAAGARRPADGGARLYEALNRVMLVDLGVPLERIAWLVGTVQPVGMLLASAVSGPLIRRLGNAGAFVAFAVLGLACLALLWWGVHAQAQAPAIAGAIGMAAVVGGLMVVCAALTLRWSVGAQAATSYAVLFCGARLAGIVATMGASRLAALIDWPTFYAAGAAALAAVTALLLVWLPSLQRENPDDCNP
jgi:MFS family permease